MSDDSRLNRLQDCVEAVHDASMRIFSGANRDANSDYGQRLASVGEAWRDFVAGSREARHADFADATASLLARIGDDLFYGRGAADEAIAAYDLALAIAPRHEESLKGIIAAYLQGSDRRPERALPYAERLAAIDPRRERDVVYISSLIQR